MRKTYGKRILGLLAVLALLLALAVPALAAEQAVFDEAALFSADEVAQLEQGAAQLGAKAHADVLLLTTDNAGGKSALAFVEDFYDQNKAQMGFSADCLLLGIDMDNRELVATGTGSVEKILINARVDQLLDETLPYLSAGRYADSATYMLSRVSQYYSEGPLEGKWVYDADSGELVEKSKKLTLTEIAIAVAVALAAFFITRGSVRGSYNLKGSTYRYDVTGNSSVIRTGGTDMYLRTSVSRVRKNDDDEGGKSAGSSSHISSGGTSFTGGSKKF